MRLLQVGTGRLPRRGGGDHDPGDIACQRIPDGIGRQPSLRRPLRRHRVLPSSRHNCRRKRRRCAGPGSFRPATGSRVDLHASRGLRRDDWRCPGFHAAIVAGATSPSPSCSTLRGLQRPIHCRRPTSLWQARWTLSAFFHRLDTPHVASLAAGIAAACRDGLGICALCHGVQCAFNGHARGVASGRSNVHGRVRPSHRARGRVRRLGREFPQVPEHFVSSPAENTQGARSSALGNGTFRPCRTRDVTVHTLPDGKLTEASRHRVPCASWLRLQRPHHGRAATSLALACGAAMRRSPEASISKPPEATIDGPWCGSYVPTPNETLGRRWRNELHEYQAHKFLFRRAEFVLTHMWNGPVSKIFQRLSPLDGAVICPACQRGR
ncbi:hypothetical protein X971_5209 (plasmid) [Agrobacterium tumefaciens LBA4213 (Ach5)]|nr:hypothetical protein X971_5209 [Agrobacterium tumefaciens LBA4213 (Ach5)]